MSEKPDKLPSPKTAEVTDKTVTVSETREDLETAITEIDYNKTYVINTEAAECRGYMALKGTPLKPVSHNTPGYDEFRRMKDVNKDCELFTEADDPKHIFILHKAAVKPVK